jgi:hypothetical protein
MAVEVRMRERKILCNSILKLRAFASLRENFSLRNSHFTRADRVIRQ